VAVDQEARKARDHVDQRRAEVGLGPLAEYLAGMAKFYTPDS
jgi:hypothetical protein